MQSARIHVSKDSHDRVLNDPDPWGGVDVAECIRLGAMLLLLISH